MEPVLNFIQKMQLHPVVDHFTVSLLIVAVLLDLVASLAPMRTWIRHAALALMILGALAAGGSFLTGGMEADRIWKALGQPAQQVLKTHAMLGEYLAIAFGILALWRILIQAFLFMQGSRAIYLIVAIVAIVMLGYSAHLGGVLVYDYGAGTALMASAPVPSESGSASSPAAAPTVSGPLPTVSVPTASPTPIVSPSATASPIPSPEETARPLDSPTPQPSATATSASM